MGRFQRVCTGKVCSGKLFFGKYASVILLVLLSFWSLNSVAQLPPTPQNITSTDGNYTLDYDLSSTVGNDWRWGWLVVYSSNGEWEYQQYSASPYISATYTGQAEGVYLYGVDICFYAAEVMEDVCTGPLEMTTVTVSYPVPSVPTSFSAPATSSNGSYAVTWGATASTHQLQRQVNGSAWVDVQNSSANSYSESGLSDATYGYRVRACDIACSAWTGTQSTVVTNTPVFSSSISGVNSDTTGSYTLSWSAASGTVTYYELQRSQGSWLTIQQNLNLSRSESGQLDSNYSYRVRACNSLTCSSWSPTKTVQVLATPSTPGAISVPSTSLGSHPVSWGTASGTVDNYELQRRINGGAWLIRQISPGTNASESGLADGLYEYRVQACNALSCSGFSSIASAQVTNVAGAPGSISGQSFSTNGNYTLTWGGASGTVDTYNLERRVSGGSWATRQNTNTLSVDETGLASDSYEYRVQACNSVGCSAWTTVHSIDVVLAPGIPSSINVSPTTSTDGNFTIDWGVSSGVASFYELERQDNGGVWTTIATITNSPWIYSDTGLSDGVYTYRVRACHTLGSTTNCSAYATAAPYAVAIASIAPPNLTINAPLAGSQVILGDPVVFFVSASDDVDGNLNNNVQWSSNLDGVLGSGDGLIVSSLSLGTHTITASVTNSSSLSASSNTSLTVVNPSGGSGSREVFSGTFDSVGDTQGFVYLDDVFRNSASPNYASGNHLVDSTCDNAGCLYVELAGIDANNISHMSGAWQKTFTLNAGESASITFRYFFDQGPNYEPSEFSEALFSVDGVQIGTQGNDYLFHVAGDGDGGVALSTNGWITETIDLGELGAGTHTIEIGAYNNYKTSAGEFTSMWIDDVVLTADGGSSTPQAPTLSITQPSVGSQVTLGNSVTFLASASDSIDGDLSANVQWVSNIDGLFGVGDAVTVNSLSVGSHFITASVVNSSSLSTVAFTSLAVSSSSSGGSGSREVFNGRFNSAGDTQGFVYLDDVFRNSASPNYASGNHVVDSSCDNGGCLYVELAGIDGNNITDMSGAWQKSFTLDAGESASITFRYFFDQGSNYESHEFSEAIFSVGGVQIGTQGNDYLFHIAGDGDGGVSLSTNGWVTETFELGELGAGTHTIEIGAYNNYKTSAGEFTSMWIDDVVLTATGGIPSNSAPSVNVLAPTGSSSFSLGQTVVFSALANDAEDGDLSSIIQWSSNLDGNLGSGGLVYANNLSVGTHQITATVSDSSGATSSDVLTLNITVASNNPPSVSIVAPSAGSMLSQGSTVTFNATASDPEDGDLSANVQWSSDINGLLGSGASISTNFLSIGDHNITANVQDINGSPASDTINITVTVSAPAPPGAIDLPISDDDGTFSLSWGASPSSVSRYELQRRTFSGDWVTIQDINSTNRSESGLSANNYSYHVRACVGTLCSAWTPSTAIQILSAAPTAVDPLNDPISGPEYTGRLDGGFSVGQDGNANYSISIDVPPGINGVQPNLSLSYHSARRNGLMGWGWNISGMSSISRCPATLQSDGFASGINDGDAYRYCFGGQPLVNVGGNEYRTETESYTRVYLVSGAWEVHSRSGRIMYYGQTSNSTEDSSGGQPVTWHLNRSQDASGNYYTVSYTKNASTGEHRPSIISYTKNDSGFSLNNTVEFIYVDRPDVMEKYVAGAPRLDNKRLDRVDVKANGNLVRNYQLTYQTYDGQNYAEPTQLSRLTQVQMCYENLTHCAPASEFEWSDASKSVYTPMANNNLSNPNLATAAEKQIELTRLQGSTFSPEIAAVIADEPFFTGTSFNSTEFHSGVPIQQAFLLSGGVGLSNDVSFLSGASCLDYLRAASSSRLDFTTGSAMTTFSNTFFGEYSVFSISAHLNANSSLDLVRWTPTGWVIHYDYLDNLQMVSIPAFTTEAACETWGENYLASTSSVALPDVNSLGTPVDINFPLRWRNKIETIDFNGDGRLDLMFKQSSGVEGPIVMINSGSGFTYDANYSTYSAGGRLIDVNGDGLLDRIDYGTSCLTDGPKCITQENAPYGVAVTLNTGSGWQLIETWASFIPWKFFRSVTVADVNGDQLPDIVGYKGEVLINTGSSFQLDSNWPAQTNFYESSDYIQYKHVSGFSGAYSTSNEISPPINLRDAVADMNGDGLADIVTLRDAGLWVRLSSGTGFLPRQLWTTQVKRSDLFYGTLGDYFSVADINRDGYGDIIFSKKRFENPITQIRYAYRGHYVGYSRGKVNNAGGLTDGFTIHLVEENLQAYRWNESQVHGNTSDIPRFAGQEIDALWGRYGRQEIPMHITSIKKDVTKNHDDISVNFGLLSDSSLYQLDNSIGGVVQYATDLPTEMASNSYISFSGFISYHPPAQAVSPATLKRRYRVKSVDIFDGQDDVHTRDYQYFNSGHHNGWGDLGFEKITVTQNYNDGSDIKRTTTQYSQVATDQYNHAGYKLKETSWVTDLNRGVLQKTSEMVNFWNIRTNLSGGSIPHFAFDLDESRSQSWDLNGTVKTTQTNRVLAYFDPTPTSCGDPAQPPGVGVVSPNSKRDSFGNVAQQVSIVCGANDTHITSVKKLFTDPVAAAEGKETDLATTRTDIVSGFTTTHTRTASATYDWAARPLTTTREPNDPLLALTTSYAYDANGFVNTMTESWNDQVNDGLASTTRQSTITTTFNTLGERTVDAKNPLQQTSTQVFDARGLLINSTGINGLTTFMDYDDLGRPILETRADSTTTQMSYAQCGSCPASAAYYVQSKATGATPVREYFDEFGRSIRTESYGLNRALRLTQTNYDRRGRVFSQSEPFGVADTPLFTFFDYDTLDRVVQTTFPDTSTTNVVFNGFVTTITNPIVQQKIKTVDAIGQVIESEDNAGTSVFLTYTPFGDLHTSSVAGNVTTIDYDNLGRRTMLDDPNTGVSSYTNNIFGAVSRQVDAEGQVTQFDFDVLGRPIRRIDDVTGLNQIHAFNYFSSGDGIGQLQSVVGVDTNGTFYAESYTYNSLGLPESTTITIDGVDYTTEQYYDAFSRPSDKIYPTGFMVRSEYNNSGYLSSLVDPAGDGVWAANADDARGNITQFSLGNGVVTNKTYQAATGLIHNISAANGSVVVQDQTFSFDALGNLTRREDNRNGLDQRFCYDNMNRLKDDSFNSCSSSSNNYQYDALGNITHKADVGAYQYAQTGNAGPHAVTSAGATSYQYDLNGNLISASGATSRTVEYTAFGKPKLMTGNGNETAITYGSNQNRVKRVDDNDRTMTYIGGILEKVEDANSTVYRHYIAEVAVYIQETTASSTTDEYQYLHHDHIGTVVATTNESVLGIIDVEWTGMNAWGERLVDNWGGAKTGPDFPTYATDKGFTGHEHLDGVGLIHMNGRVYDPEIGRFLSADPLVQAPFNTQSYNRYSYVFNNPVSFVDPTGYCGMMKNRSRCDASNGFITIDYQDNKRGNVEGTASAENENSYGLYIDPKGEKYLIPVDDKGSFLSGYIDGSGGIVRDLEEIVITTKRPSSTVAEYIGGAATLADIVKGALSPSIQFAAELQSEGKFLRTDGQVSSMRFNGNQPSGQYSGNAIKADKVAQQSAAKLAPYFKVAGPLILAASYGSSYAKYKAGGSRDVFHYEIGKTSAIYTVTMFAGNASGLLFTADIFAAEVIWHSVIVPGARENSRVERTLIDGTGTFFPWQIPRSAYPR